MKCCSVLALACLAAAASASRHHRGADAELPGGWSPASVDDVKKVYYNASQSEASYPNANTPRLCATEFTSAESQVVAGINYKLNVKACPVSSAKDTSPTCACLADNSPKSYVVGLFTNLNGVSTVSSVALSSPSNAATTNSPTDTGGVSPSRPATAEEKAIFTRATTDDANYGNSQLVRVCASEIVSVSTQVVAGMNYVFTVKGCAVDKAPMAMADCTTTCAAKQATTYQVKVFADLNNSVKVSDVSSLLGAPDSPSNATNGNGVAATNPTVTTAKPSAATGLSLAFTAACVATVAVSTL